MRRKTLTSCQDRPKTSQIGRRQHRIHVWCVGTEVRVVPFGTTTREHVERKEKKEEEKKKKRLGGAKGRAGGRPLLGRPSSCPTTDRPPYQARNKSGKGLAGEQNACRTRT